MGLVRTPTASRWAPDSSGRDMKVTSVTVKQTSVVGMCPWTTQPTSPTQTTTMLGRTTTAPRIS